eukprot:30606-Rhodomonas_salina.1
MCIRDRRGRERWRVGKRRASEGGMDAKQKGREGQRRCFQGSSHWHLTLPGPRASLNLKSRLKRAPAKSGCSALMIEEYRVPGQRRVRVKGLLVVRGRVCGFLFVGWISLYPGTLLFEIDPRRGCTREGSTAAPELEPVQFWNCREENNVHTHGSSEF